MGYMHVGDLTVSGSCQWAVLHWPLVTVCGTRLSYPREYRIAFRFWQLSQKDFTHIMHLDKGLQVQNVQFKHNHPCKHFNNMCMVVIWIVLGCHATGDALYAIMEVKSYKHVDPCGCNHSDDNSLLQFNNLHQQFCSVFFFETLPRSLTCEIYYLRLKMIKNLSSNKCLALVANRSINDSSSSWRVCTLL